MQRNPADLIDFDSFINASTEDRDLVRSCPWFLQQIEQRTDNFDTSQVLVKGISLIGEGEKRRVLKIDARVFYKNPDGSDASYHLSFLPDGGSLLLVFRVADREITDAKNYHIAVIEQPRWGPNRTASLELPVGLLRDDEQLDVESVKKGILREFFEEVGADMTALLKLDQRDVHSLGTPMTDRAAITDQQYQFYTVIDTTQNDLDAIKSKIEGKFGGVLEEGERTTPGILPIAKAKDELLNSGNAPWMLTAIERYARIAGLHL